MRTQGYAEDYFVIRWIVAEVWTMCFISMYRWLNRHFKNFVYPRRSTADVIIPRGAENDIAITVISQRIIDVLTNMKKCIFKDSKNKTKIHKKHKKYKIFKTYKEVANKKIENNL